MAWSPYAMAVIRPLEPEIVTCSWAPPLIRILGTVTLAVGKR